MSDFSESSQWQLSSERVFIKMRLIDIEEHFFYSGGHGKMFAKVLVELNGSKL